MGSYAGLNPHIDCSLPGPSIGDEQAMKYTVDIGEFGLVSLREIHNALANRRQCICNPSTPTALLEYCSTAGHSQDTQSLTCDNSFLEHTYGFDSFASSYNQLRYSPAIDAMSKWPGTEFEPLTDCTSTNKYPSSFIAEATQSSTENIPRPLSAPAVASQTTDLVDCDPDRDVAPARTSAMTAKTVTGSSIGHAAQPSFICSECRESFPTYYTLEAHARTTTHRAYVCTVMGCNSKYHRRDVFVRHLKTHRESGLHVCKICEQADRLKRFKRKDHLRQHVRNVHPNALMDSAMGTSSSAASRVHTE